MASDQYIWIPGQEPPTIEQHSLAKHEVLRAYLEKYVAVLTSNVRRDVLRLTLVDGFCGGGLYIDARSHDFHVGSPLIMIEAMQAAQLEAQARRAKPFHLDAEFVFVEEKRDTIAYLKALLVERGYGGLLESRVNLVHGQFESHFGNIAERIKRRGSAERAIFILDQYGYADVPLPLLRTIFGTLQNAEVILTFATDWLIDYLSDSQESQQIRQRIGLSLPIESISAFKEDRGSAWKQAIQVLLHDELASSSSAGYFTPFFIVSAEAHRSYWLVHLSNHPRAKDVMTELHWEKHNHFAHYGRPGLDMLGYDPRKDLIAQGYQALRFDFDSHAEIRLYEELMQQLPERVAANARDGIVFDSLFAKLTNRMPATKQQLREAVRRLSQDRELEVVDKTGKLRSRGCIPKDDDIVRVPRQPKLFHM